MNSSSDIHVDVHRRYDQDYKEAPYVVLPRRRRISGVTRFTHTFRLCVLVIPILFVAGLVTEIWFYFNPWGHAFLNVRYAKAILYIGVWYSLMKVILPRFVTNTLTVFFIFAGIGMVLSCEPAINTWGVEMWAGAWIPFWVKLQWGYWAALAVTYLYAWCKLAHGPRHWILKYGIG